LLTDDQNDLADTAGPNKDMPMNPLLTTAVLAALAVLG
jgi:hypothetical protein